MNKGVVFSQPCLVG